ncbi:hypothetical protein ANN_19948 [Periplaneta americana]|uniref:Uncharacterized protein n=1 Tax=Periplaneta americana TaxID=6978 RepID=A0ABQ8SBA1_PERAM|nr:hypothetical protein ANN_19948 [Periplaneta americana]
MRVMVPQLNNFTFTFPPSPLLTQADDVSPDILCQTETPPHAARGRLSVSASTSSICHLELQSNLSSSTKVRQHL